MAGPQHGVGLPLELNARVKRAVDPSVQHFLGGAHRDRRVVEQLVHDLIDGLLDVIDREVEHRKSGGLVVWLWVDHDVLAVTDIKALAARLRVRHDRSNVTETEGIGAT